MKFIADFHIHSHFSIATSKQLIPEYLDYWARLKGITLVGTGDFTHPGWVKELEEKLEPAEEGLFRLKEAVRKESGLHSPFLPSRDVRFMLTAEISNIYKKNGKVRKVHNLIFAPDFETVKKIQNKLTALGGNITSDGRPILGLDSRDLLELCLEASDRIFFVPAHIWTPWFSVLGSKSGFETIEECFGDLVGHIHAVETGLSSDPPMNWMCSFLDAFTLISNSDAHSPEKLGRNANIFNAELSYERVTGALKNTATGEFLGTIDLFPQEGKYHYDGHRKCGISWDPLQTLDHQGICPVCRKKVTVGVMNRVAAISDRETLAAKSHKLPFHSIIPLKEILSEILSVSPSSKKVDREYFAIMKKGTPELQLLLDNDIDEVRSGAGELVAQAVQRMRNREVQVTEGFDGEYGRIKVFSPGDIHQLGKQGQLFSDSPDCPPKISPRKLIDFDLEAFRELQRQQEEKSPGEEGPDTKPAPKEPSSNLAGLNPGQSQAAQHQQGPALVIAGPGTGKTRVLTSRIAHLVCEKKVDPGKVLAVTFTNKAAGEMKERLNHLLSKEAGYGKLQVCTFHSLGLELLKEILADPGKGETDRDHHFNLIDQEDRRLILKEDLGCPNREAASVSNQIAIAKQELKNPGDLEDARVNRYYRDYEDYMETHNLVDLEDLVFLPVRLIENQPELSALYKKRFDWIMVDEYQDINRSQYGLLSCLAQKEFPNLFVIGDPDQAIYGFRGADVSFIRQFMDDFPGAELYRLSRSYRCSDSILQASRDVLDSPADTDLSGLDKGVKLKILRNHTHRSEAEYVARTIEEMMGGLRFFSMDSDITVGQKSESIESLGDFAVLVRTRGQMDALKKAFNDHSIPFQAVGEKPFFKEEPQRSLVDLTRLTLRPADSFLEKKLCKRLGLKHGDLGNLRGLLEEKKNLPDFLAVLIERFFPGEVSAFKELLDLAAEYGADYDGFLRLVTLGVGVDTYRPELEGVTLMTLHASKGLEFKCVFIVGCEEGLLPYTFFKEEECDRQEERRLLYVGMTRAEKFLFLTHADRRTFHGKDRVMKRSSFLETIEKELIELSRQQQSPPKKESFSQPSLFND